MKLRLVLERTGGNTTGFPIADDIVEQLGGGRRPPVTATVNGYSWRSTIANMGGSFWLGASAAVREASGMSGGDLVDIDIELDTEPRVVQVPPDVRTALAENPAAAAAFDKLAFSHQRRHVEAIDDAKTPDTRARRIAKAIEMLEVGKK